MTKKKKDEPPEALAPRVGRALGALALLGAVAALWALFLWTELVASRGGATPFCAFATGADCGALWDAAFASAVHRYTRLPVAAWGLVWGLAALALPVLALAALAEGRDDETTISAVRWTAVAGVAGVVVLLGASAAEGLFCTSCALTYVASLAYAAIAFWKLPQKTFLVWPGLDTSLAAVAVAFVLLLFPGLKTPKSTASAEERALAQAGEQARAAARESPKRPPTPPASSRTRSATNPEFESLLGEFLASVQPQVSQMISDSLGIYRGSREHQEEPRALRGAPGAPVRITDFTDAKCGHCATLHGTFEYLESILPSGSFSVDSRHFPLDGNCNARLAARGPETVRCLAARAQICMEGKAGAFAFSGAIFQAQDDLSEELVYQLAERYLDRATLTSCAASPETRQKLAADVEYAWQFQPDGTPLVLVDGRRGTSFGPFLYALILAGGDADHPLFESLPPPRAEAHIH